MNGNGFTKVPNVVIADWSLSDAEFRTYVTLLAFRYGSDTEVHPGQDTLAAVRGVSSRAIRVHQGGIEDSGLVRTTRRGLGRTNSYELVDVDQVYDEAMRENVSQLAGNGVAKDRAARLSQRQLAVAEMRKRAASREAQRASPTTTDAPPRIKHIDRRPKQGKESE